MLRNDEGAIQVFAFVGTSYLYGLFSEEFAVKCDWQPYLKITLLHGV